jgi:hypothetical protein
MQLGMKEISEDTAVAMYINFLANAIKRDWEKIYQNLKDLAKETGINHDITIVDEKKAIDTFFGANVALNTQAINNLFSKEQATRLEKAIINVINDEYRTEVTKYKEIYNKALVDIENPVSAISYVVLSYWLGEEIKKLKEHGLSLLFLVMYIEGLFIGYGNYWITIKEKYKLI